MRLPQTGDDMTAKEQRMRRKVDRRQLEKFRAQLGLTQQELADLLGVHVRTWAKWIGGERACPWSVFVLLRMWVADPTKTGDKPLPERSRKKAGGR